MLTLNAPESVNLTDSGRSPLIEAYVRGEPRPTFDADTERACLARARAGDERAFAELYRAHAPRLYRQVLLPKLGDAHAAEDVLSETFRTLLQHLDEVGSDGRRLWPWLCRVATNRAIDMHRKRARGTRILCSFEPLLAPLAAHDGEHDDPELERREREHAIGRTLSGLHPRYKRAIELRFFEEHPRERCANLMQVKLGTFDVLLLRALRAFRREWEAALVASAAQIDD